MPHLSDDNRRELAARAGLSAGALLPYWRLLTFGVVLVTDDYSSSDIFNGELPGRVIAGQLLRQGELPVWTTLLCSGTPMAGAPADPLGLAAFTLLPTAAALDLYLIVLLLVAAHGAYAFARRLGADRAGAVLAGIAFAGSGFVATQLKHLSILGTVVWLPYGLVLLDRILASGDGKWSARRALLTSAFGLLFANQVLAGFPQSTYISALVYAAFALFRVVERWRVSGPRRSAITLSALAAATVLGAASGAVVLLPLNTLGSLSTRIEALGYEWATQFSYWPPNLLNFVSPYMFGDISNNSYRGPSVFWEDYGYVGVATLALGVFAVARIRGRAIVWFVVAMTVVAMLLVLGKATPVFHAAYVLLPGLDRFRLPTRFLFVVELGLCTLAALGLTMLRQELVRLTKPASALPTIVVLMLCLGTTADLFIHQSRQNPMVRASEWLKAPASVSATGASPNSVRTFTPEHLSLHQEAFIRARGWSDVRPYFELRDVLQPNIGAGYWNIPSADCYAGLVPRWTVDTWGDHNRDSGLLADLGFVDRERHEVHVDDRMPALLAAYGVTHMLSPVPVKGAVFPPGPVEVGAAYVYPVQGAARARFVRGARLVSTDEEAKARLLSPGFNPDDETLLHDTPASTSPQLGSRAGSVSKGGSASISSEGPRNVVVEVDAPEDGYLLLADTFYPGWSADVDGTQAPIYRANLSVRAVPVSAGRHTVRFSFEPPVFAVGLTITSVALGLLLVWAAVAAYVALRR